MNVYITPLPPRARSRIPWNIFINIIMTMMTSEYVLQLKRFCLHGEANSAQASLFGNLKVQ